MLRASRRKRGWQVLRGDMTAEECPSDIGQLVLRGSGKFSRRTGRR